MFTTTETMSDAQRRRYSLQTGPVEKQQAKLLRILGKIFATTLQTKRAFRESDSNGITFMTKLRNLAIALDLEHTRTKRTKNNRP